MTTPRGEEPDVSALLAELSAGRRGALDEIVTLVYADLRSIAHRHLIGERSSHTLNTTELVHEAFVRLVDLQRIQWQDLPHFTAMASRMMRRILIDYARRRDAKRRGGEILHVPLTGAEGSISVALDDLIALDSALEELETIAPRRCRVVECRFFAGLTIDETAEALGVASGTVKRDWRLAREWLNRKLAGPEESGHDGREDG